MSEEEKVSVRRSDGEVEELTPDELEQLNYERKIRDQESAGKRITAKQINIAAVIICAIGLVYALPRLMWSSGQQQSGYVPLDERDAINSLDVLPPLPREPNAFLEGTPSTDFTTSSNPVSDPTPEIEYEEIVELEPVVSSVQENPETNEAPIDTASTNTADVILEETVESEPSEEDIISAAILAAEQWASDWAAQDVDAYLSHYAQSFVSTSGQNLQEWRNYRRDRVARPEWIEIKLNNMDATLTSTNTARVSFDQIYSASNYADQSRKELSLILEQGSWKINRETTLN